MLATLVRYSYLKDSDHLAQAILDKWIVVVVAVRARFIISNDRPNMPKHVCA
jgi:hypothetical protein